ncbi:hypothetical protein D9758_003412 [Tetrapyrgos nigripes]|uniref:Protein-tyrosine-phosphatase n=1 Tax=Tetrapyrgos nigripes TaxID=182062 RepID=A0A8H5GUV6_9AGAR|nr:hypothetical protein D9758_003412 [Tetrapyrgos nigripes]
MDIVCLRSYDSTSLSEATSVAPLTTPTTNIKASTMAEPLETSKADTPDPIHGLSYPQSFLSSLPTSSSFPTLSASQFDALHYSHLLSHPPDSVLFPFLHGLEGGNQAQNAFFGTQAYKEYKQNRDVNLTCSGSDVSHLKPPKYRGMIWVICEEDLDNPDKDLKVIFHRPPTHVAYDSDSESYLDDDEEDELLDEDEDEDPELKSPEDMDVDVGLNIAVADNGDVEPGGDETVMEIVGVGSDEKHMHPIQHKQHIPTATSPGLHNELQNTETQPSTHTPSLDLSANPLHTQQRTPRTPPRSSKPILTSTFRASELIRRVPPTSSYLQSKYGDTNMHMNNEDKGVNDDDEDGDWEFVPLNVPEGISLRNFGIQVASVSSVFVFHCQFPKPVTLQAVLATLSDIVIYSPTSIGAAHSPNAIRLAARFQKAIKRKWSERYIRMISPEANGHGNGDVDVGSSFSLPSSPSSASSPSASAPNSNSENKDDKHSVSVSVSPEVKGTDRDLPMTYNVFLLDATADAIRTHLPHLVGRLVKPGDVPGSLVELFEGSKGKDLKTKDRAEIGAEKNTHSGAGAASNANMDLDTVMADAEPEAMNDDTGVHPSQKSNSNSNPNPDVPPNTVDFAQRERDEMRDLTRASEVISIWPEGHLLKVREMERERERERRERAQLPDAHGRGHGHDNLVNDHDHDQVPASVSVSALSDTEIDIHTTMTYWDPTVGQIFLGNTEDVPLPFGHGDEGWDPYKEVDFEEVLKKEKGKEGKKQQLDKDEYAWSYKLPIGNAPCEAQGYDVCIECVDGSYVPYPSSGHLKSIEEKIGVLEDGWKARCEKEREVLYLRRKRMKEDADADTDHSVEDDLTDVLPPRPAPHANSIVHLSMPSSAPHAHVQALLPILRFLQSCLQPSVESIRMKPLISDSEYTETGSHSPDSDEKGAEGGEANQEQLQKGRRWSSVSMTSLMSSFPSFPLNATSTHSPSGAGTPLPPSSSAARLRALTSPAPFIPSPLASSDSSSTASGRTSYQRQWTRPLKILLYSTDGYTESSVPALCLLMAIKQLDAPRAYLELQTEKKRSFFVYQPDLTFLKRVQDVLAEERRQKERERREKEDREKRQRERDRERREFERNLKRDGDDRERSPSIRSGVYGFGTHTNPYSNWALNGDARPSPAQSNPALTTASSHHQNRTTQGSRPAAKSVSFAHSPLKLGSSGGGGLEIIPQRSSEAPPVVSMENYSGMMMNAHDDSDLKKSTTLPPTLPSLSSSSLGTMTGSHVLGNSGGGRTRRPRANTSPWLPSLFGVDHHNWFNDSRFDGSFPSRVLPFLYLGNLNHASNVYMLQALGITHVVSVGECALIPPPNQASQGSFGFPNSSHFVPGRPTDHQGSLWVEQRAGRMKVLDIENVCDDGIDTLEPQLEPICDWIDQARKEGGKVLVHCRVGVSRSATVVIAYVMKHLSMSLVDAYLIVRSRRLSVLIQPNMRLLYNLLGWEIKLAKERALGDECKLRNGLSTALTWPFLAKEIHALNEKYLR